MYNGLGKNLVVYLVLDLVIQMIINHIHLCIKSSLLVSVEQHIDSTIWIVT
jgi:hypothetical protein